MRHISTVAHILILLAASFLTPGRLNNHVSGRGGVEQELIRLESELTAAILRRDAAFFERVLAEDYIFTDSGGNVHSKVEMLTSLRSGDLVNETYTLSELRVRLYGGAAVVTGRSKTKWRAGNDGAIDQDRFTDVFVKQKPGWKLVASQTTRISREAQPTQR